MGAIRGQGIKVSRQRARASYLKAVATSGFPARKPIIRRQYFVRAPLSLWHIDGNHLLIR